MVFEQLPHPLESSSRVKLWTQTLPSSTTLLSNASSPLTTTSFLTRPESLAGFALKVSISIMGMRFPKDGMRSCQQLGGNKNVKLFRFG